ncbi:MAG: acetyl/propionyl/methylcrotonyl-CoA carboxylase subunit alpha, partial [Paracoccaceae bacterium]|nr:acetyl/propionyl/methylcrotonyl-CoA carboxylase subunit alpha [Paracoccaceae bacterium]
MFDRLLIANRGEIACRVMKTAKQMGIKTIAVFSDADRQALHVQMADESVNIGPPPANQSYIDIEKVISAVEETKANAVHPGYGFLSENAKFAKALSDIGVTFIGPPEHAIKSMGDKITSKKIAQDAGVNTVPGYMGIINDDNEAVRISKQIGYPVMIKASAGGGGKGMRIAWNDTEVKEGFESSKNEAASSFGDDRIFIEKFVTQPRHIEIQILADTQGNCIYLGERECSIQRRNQKVVEEAPSSFLDEKTRKEMGEQACKLAKAVGYFSAGTVEFIVDRDKNFYFLEMNTRLQVEHPVTELITGIDLVEQMISIASGKPLSISQKDIKLSGWAIESRLYAEDPYCNFLPSIGRLTRYRPPTEVKEKAVIVRNDTGVFEGGEISMYYDPMIAKLCTWAPNRAKAIEQMRTALDRFELEGIGHNLPFLSAVMDHERFVSGNITTAFIEEEYPDGFNGVDLSDDKIIDLAACAAAMNRVAEIRRTKISGRMDNHERRVGDDWVVQISGKVFSVNVSADTSGANVIFEDKTSIRITGDWFPGKKLANMNANDSKLVIKMSKLTGGFRMRMRGADLKVLVRSPRQAELSEYMQEKLPPDTSKMLLCPMPGLIVKIDVKAGQEVQEGQPLCTVEAMKMENILRAERTGTIAKINSNVGDSLAVDDV